MGGTHVFFGMIRVVVVGLHLPYIFTNSSLNPLFHAWTSLTDFRGNTQVCIAMKANNYVRLHNYTIPCFCFSFIADYCSFPIPLSRIHYRIIHHTVVLLG